MSRYRSFTSAPIFGTKGQFGSSYQAGFSKKFSEITDNRSAPHSVLAINHIERSGGLINGNPGGEFDAFFENFPCDMSHGVYGPGHLPIDRPSNGALMTKLLARTNPASADVDLSVFIPEIRDIPDIVKKFHGSAFRRIADTNLRYQFGVKPLVSDILKLVNFSKLAESRFKLLKRLQRDGSLLTSRSLFNGAASSSSPVIPHSNGCFISGTRTVVTSSRVWGYAVWQATDSTKYAAHDQLMQTAWIKSLGLLPTFESVWELIPWSFLADYFSNIGDFIAATSNRSVARPVIQRLCQTDYTIEEIVREDFSDPRYQFETMVSSRLSKSRFPAEVSLDIHFDSLSGRQLGILASLAAVKGK